MYSMVEYDWMQVCLTISSLHMYVYLHNILHLFFLWSNQKARCLSFQFEDFESLIFLFIIPPKS